MPYLATHLWTRFTMNKSMTKRWSLFISASRQQSATHAPNGLIPKIDPCNSTALVGCLWNVGVRGPRSAQPSAPYKTRNWLARQNQTAAAGLKTSRLRRMSLSCRCPCSHGLADACLPCYLRWNCGELCHHALNWAARRVEKDLLGVVLGSDTLHVQC